MKACSGWFSTTIKLFVNFLAVSRSFQQIYYVIIFCCVNILKAVHFVIVVAVLPHTRRATCFSFLLVLFADCCYFAIGWSRHWCQVITRQVIYAKKVSIPPGSPDAAAAARAFLFPLETRLRLSRNMLHGWKDNSMLAKPLAACTYLSSIVSELYDA